MSECSYLKEQKQQIPVPGTSSQCRVPLLAGHANPGRQGPRKIIMFSAVVQWPHIEHLVMLILFSTLSKDAEGQYICSCLRCTPISPCSLLNQPEGGERGREGGKGGKGGGEMETKTERERERERERTVGEQSGDSRALTKRLYFIVVGML
jgi:hypothetical protein